MGITEYWKRFKAAVWKSWTMNAIWILTLLGVAESQFELLRPTLGEKAYGIAYFVVLAIVGLARIKGLNASVKAEK